MEKRRLKSASKNGKAKPIDVSTIQQPKELKIVL